MIGGEASLQSQKVKICFYAHHFSWLLRFDEATTFFCERFSGGEGKLKQAVDSLHKTLICTRPLSFDFQSQLFEGSSFSQKSCVLKA